MKVFLPLLIALVWALPRRRATGSFTKTRSVEHAALLMELRLDAGPDVALNLDFVELPLIIVELVASHSLVHVIPQLQHRRR